jgi:hypothetical protein
MNVFATSTCPVASAQALDDKRVIKMVLESAQLLSNAIHLSGGTGPYKPTHIKHPCTKWVQASSANYMWLVAHFTALCREYTLRYDKIHACERLLPKFIDGRSLIPYGVLTPHPNCTPYKDMPVHTAYQLTLADKWDNDKQQPTWYRR